MDRHPDEGKGYFKVDQRRINKERGMTIVYVTHDQIFAQMSSRQIDLVDGMIV